MKKSFVTAAALAFAMGVMADALPAYSWFTATPGNIPTGCAWNTTPEVEGEGESSAWVIDTDDVDSIFTPTSLQSDKKTTVSVDIAFGAAYAVANLPAVANDVQAGLVLGIADDVTNYYGLVSGGWKKLSGTVPGDLQTEVAVKIEMDYAASPVTVAFYVGDTQLTDAEDSSVTTFARFGGTSAAKVTSVAFSGTGKVSEIAGASDPKYVAGDVGYVDFATAAANAGNNPVKLYANAAYTFPTTGNSALKVEANGYTFTPTFDTGTYNYSSTASGVTTYTYKNSAAFGGGDGTQATPYLIANATDFAELAFFAENNDFSGKYFSQTEAVVATKAIPQFAGIYNGGNNALSYASGAIFTTATGATFNNLVLSGALIGTASGAIASSGCTMTGTVKPITTLASGATVSGLNFATLASDIYTFCATPSAAGTYYVMLDNAEVISFGAAVDDVLALTAFDSATYAGTVSTTVAQAKVTSATVASTATYTIAWDTVEVTIEDAEHGTVTDVAATGSGVDPVKGEGSTYTVVKDDTIMVTYTASENYVSSGNQTTTTVDFTAASGASATPPTFTLGKAKYDDVLYATVQDAVTAAAANGEIVLVADSSDTVEVGKALTFKGADVAVGTITITAAVPLTIEKGKYGTITPMSGASVVIKGGYYQNATNDVQALCALGYFAQAYDGSPYITQVVAGEVIVPVADIPTIAVEPDFFPAEVKTAEQKETYLTATEANSQPRWVNYALGIDGTQAANTPKLDDVGDADTVVIDLTNGQVKPGTGITAKLMEKQGENWVASEGEVELDDATTQTGTSKIRLVLSDGNAKNDTTVTEVDFGIRKASPANALEIISVPFTKLGSTDGLPLSQILKLKNIANGDKIYRYNATEGRNDQWTLTDGAWVGSSDPIVAPGDGLWLERADNTKPIFFFGGYQAEKTNTSVGAGKWALLANPNLSDSIDLNSAIAGEAGDQIVVETGAAPKTYTYEGGAWGYNKAVSTQRKVGNKTVIVKTVSRVTDESTIPAGAGFWFNNAGTAAKPISWTVTK